MPKQLSQDDVLLQFWKIHKFRYIYDEVDYVKNSQYVIIICRQHGEFKCTPNNHKAGKNCNQCAVITAGRLNRKKHKETIIKRFEQKHGNNYKYHNVKYIDNKTPVDIWCCNCKKFISQTPMNHLRSGCKDCGIIKSANAKVLAQEEILKRFREIHCNKQYDYDKVDYVNLKTEVTITCLKPDHGDFYQKPREHLDGSGCPKCAKEKQQITHRDTRESFICKAIDVHGDLYDYTQVEDVWSDLNHNWNTTTTPSQTKVTIICKLHNYKFTQVPNSHLQGKGCRKCGNERISLKLRDNRESFIRKAIDIHGELYDYTQVEDVWSDLDNNRHTTVPAKTNVTIICTTHGPFKITPDSHLRGNGCRTCALEQLSLKRKDNKESFICKAIHIHGELYDYTQVEDVWSDLDNNQPAKTNVTMICKYHKHTFQQTPNSHLRGSGCDICALEKKSFAHRDNRESFIRKAIYRHGELYDYTQVEDVWSDLNNNRHTKTPSNTRITIICKQHGPFYKTPSEHLTKYQNGGCKLCTPSGYSKISIQWLEFMKGYYNIDIKHAENGGEHIIKLDDKKYFCDGYATESNTIFEFNGDFWHGNPIVFERESINKVNNKSFGELYDYTMKKKRILQSKGYKYVDVWERDWRNAIKLVTCIQNIYRGSKTFIVTQF